MGTYDDQRRLRLLSSLKALKLCFGVRVPSPPIDQEGVWPRGISGGVLFPEVPGCLLPSALGKPIRECQNELVLVEMAPYFWVVVNNDDAPETVCEVVTVMGVPPIEQILDVTNFTCSLESIRVPNLKPSAVTNVSQSAGVGTRKPVYDQTPVDIVKLFPLRPET